MAWTWRWLRKPVHSQIKSSLNPKKPHCAILKVWTLVLNISSWIMVCQFIWFGVGVWGIDHYEIYWVWGLDHLRPWWDLQHCQWMPLLSCPWKKKLLWEGVKLKNRCYICVWGSFDILFKGKITYYHPQQLCYLLQIPIHARATQSLTSTTIIL